VIVAIVLLAFCTVTAPFGAFFLLRRYIEHKQAEIEGRVESALKDWMKPGENNTLSQFGQVMDAVGSVVGSAAARSIMASLSQVKSSEAQVANGISSQIEAHQNPIMALLTGGKRGQGAAVRRLAELFGGMLNQRNSGNGSESVAGSAQQKFDL
jgi:hypothetical protein